MRVCVLGLWHLGCVTAACLAQGGHDVVGLDFDGALIARLRKAEIPLAEPDLEDLVAAGLAHRRLRFESEARRALAGIDVLWGTIDTPIDEDDGPQVTAVVEPVSAVLADLPDDCLVLVSSQLPVGTTRRLAQI